MKAPLFCSAIVLATAGAAVAQDQLIINHGGSDDPITLDFAVGDNISIGSNGTITIRVEDSIETSTPTPGDTTPPSCTFLPWLTVEPGKSTSINLAQYCSDTSGLDDDFADVVSTASKGTTNSLAGPSIRYTANANASGSDSFSFRVRDNAGNLSSTQSLNVEISSDDGGSGEPPPGCSTALLPSGRLRDGGYATTPFVGDTGMGISSSVVFDSTKFVAMAFDTDSVGQFARYHLEESIHGEDPSGVVMSISECPGDFRSHLVSNTDDDCFVADPRGQLYAKVSNTPTASCDLKPNTTYYLNMTFANKFSDLTQTPTQVPPACGDSSCAVLLKGTVISQ